jgi:hypothetical protein
MKGGLPGGAYDELITVGVDRLLQQTHLEAQTEAVDPAEATELLSATSSGCDPGADSLPFERPAPSVQDSPWTFEKA